MFGGWRGRCGVVGGGDGVCGVAMWEVWKEKRRWDGREEGGGDAGVEVVGGRNWVLGSCNCW